MPAGTYRIRKKTGTEPHVLTFEVPRTDKAGKETIETLEIKFKPYVSGKEMLDLSIIQESNFGAGQHAAFDLFLLDADEKKKWAAFLDLKTNPNAPDIDELGDINNDLVARYSNRQDENPTHGTGIG